MDLSKNESEIIKTGFVLENNVASILKSKGWTLISNRYYIDDQEESVREIDLLAYKVSNLENFQVFTALIISCKKSDANIWALLSRDLDIKNPNYNYTPFHGWSNSKPIIYQISQDSWVSDYYNKMKDLNAGDALKIPDVEVFAFQEMKKDSGAPQNDKNIFSSITSLMKAQAYEINSLPERKNKPCVYQFNLLSVVDTDLVRVLFDGDQRTASLIKSEHYISRYILHKKNIVARIRFVCSKFCESIFDEYANVHKANCKIFSQKYDDFYLNLVESPKKVKILMPEFINRLNMNLFIILFKNFGERFDFEDLSIFWSKADGTLNLYISLSYNIIEFLNNNAESKECVREALRYVFKYHGDFEFDDLPF